MSEVDVPDHFKKVEHDAKLDVLVANNTSEDLRSEIDAILNLQSDGNPYHFSKYEMAELVLGLGGPV